MLLLVLACGEGAEPQPVEDRRAPVVDSSWALAEPGDAAGPGDWTGDGTDDLVVALASTRTIETHAGGPGGPAAASTDVRTLPSPYESYRLFPAGEPFGDGRPLMAVVGRAEYRDTAVLLYDATSPEPVWQIASDDRLREVGEDVEATDVDGDGVDDLVLTEFAGRGAGPRYTAAIYQGGADGPDLEPTWETELRNHSSDRMASASAGGDIDGDGYCDVAMGSLHERYRCLEPPHGVRFFAGSATGPAADATWILDPDLRAGAHIRIVPDLDGDGADDVLTTLTCQWGQWKGDEVEWEHYDAVVVLPGSVEGPGPPREAFTQRVTFGNTFGRSFVLADIDGDGARDLVVGEDNGDSRAEHATGGRGVVFRGEGGRFTNCENDQWGGWYGRIDPAPNAWLRAGYEGYFIQSLGDVNADGRGDIAITGEAIHTFQAIPTGRDCAG